MGPIIHLLTCAFEHNHNTRFSCDYTFRHKQIDPQADSNAHLSYCIMTYEAFGDWLQSYTAS